MNIKEVILRTDRLKDQKYFYHEVLGLPLLKSSLPGSLSFGAGDSVLTFLEGAEESYYHFAFTVPDNRFSQAKEWASSLVPLNPVEDKDEIYFANWDAHACYFYDPAGNIVELIARHSLNNGTQHPFTSRDILNISEIGMPVNDVKAAAEYLQKELNLDIYHNDSATFAPLGDADGLLILSDKKRNWLGSGKKANIYPVDIILGDGKTKTSLDGYPYTLRS
ncbi:VOC family protein [Fictibacillus fluitans]|uniref:VOC domain-containing protein n=1 Tax=Fictibacillus fluitans TaxID=3058422 RepID=A0ABT8HST6_9BACL|nr:hypothetical protein [Fictibacillus sp. NE201]MDN4523842.1 hypothetical protein [Fictibacillus sp. NE201]